jgi:hypothetical protein
LQVKSKSQEVSIGEGGGSSQCDNEAYQATVGPPPSHLNPPTVTVPGAALAEGTRCVTGIDNGNSVSDDETRLEGFRILLLMTLGQHRQTK